MARKFRTVGAALGMLILILDGKTALHGAREALELCLNTVIPGLFPFFVLSPVLVGSLRGDWLRPIGKLCRIPEGAESLLLVGFLGGYPTGAQCIANCCRNGTLEKQQAQRLLGFCSNAGPSFIFGILGSVFQDFRVPWLLWAIHILSALSAGILLPPAPETKNRPISIPPVTLKDSLDKAIRSMAAVCGWVVLFRILISFLERYLLWMIPSGIGIVMTGLLELTNGCCGLVEIQQEGLRFLLCSLFLSFGGLCVTMQTISVTEGLSIRVYLQGKAIQTAFSLCFAGLLQMLLSDSLPVAAAIYMTIPALLVTFSRIPAKLKNTCSNSGAIGV